MKKLICIDVDGTIAEIGTPIDYLVKNKIENSEDEFVIVSGRAVDDILKLGINVNCIGANGGEVYKDGKLIHRSIMDKIQAKQIAKYLLDTTDYVAIYTSVGKFYYQDCNFRKMISEICDVMKLEVSTQDPSKFLAGYINPSDVAFSDLDKLFSLEFDVVKIETISANNVEEICTSANTYKGVYSFSSTGINVEVVPENVNKGNGIAIYMEGENYQTFAIGDGDNDIEMFKFVDVSFAMGNGTDKLKDYATFITDHIKDNGFLNAVQRIEEEY